MAERDPKTGRFVRADGKPTLHRQVWTDDGKASATVRLYDADGNPKPLDGWDFMLQRGAPEWFQADPPKPSRWPWFLLLTALAVVVVAMLWLGAAADGGLLLVGVGL